MIKYKILRKKYPQFVYDNFSWQIEGKNLRIFFNFRIPPDIEFSPEVIIENINFAGLKKTGKEIVDNLVFNLGLVEMISYWKATCSSEIIIKCGHLDNGQIRWWRDLIIKGMGQYFFENKINFRPPDFIKIICFSPKSYHDQKPTIVGKLLLLKKRFLVPLGGGKDSIVTLEFLKEAKKEIRYFSLNPNIAVERIMKIAGGPKPIIVRRQIDPKLLELNRQGFLNGHTPFSAYLAFLSVLVAILFDYRYLAFSNERSANEGNVRYLGQKINHQYSKSFTFENKFREYCAKYLVRGVEYFSFLRPLYELQIAKLFSRYPKYFKAFLSCNQALATKSGTRKPSGKWCGQCPKCLFVFASLYPFLDEKKMVEIFGQNLFSKKELLPIMQELIGERKFKPFECVGTTKESLVAFYLSWEKEKKRGERPCLLDYFEREVLPKYPNLKLESKKILNSRNLQKS